jgi:hypothetical protein
LIGWEDRAAEIVDYIKNQMENSNKFEETDTLLSIDYAVLTELIHDAINDLNLIKKIQ